MKRLPKLGALSASAALVLASLVPLTAAAEETPEPEETATVEATEAETARTQADEESKPRLVSEIDPTSIDPIEAPPAGPTVDAVDEPAVEEPVVEEPVADELDDAVEQLTETTEPEPLAEPSVAAPAETDEESATADESPMVEAQQDDAESDVRVWLDPSWGLDQRHLEEGRAYVLGTGFPASTAVTVTLAGQTIATGESLDNGGVNLRLSGFVEPGAYTLTVTVGDVSASLDVTVEAGGYDTELCVANAACYVNTPGEISAWDMSRSGLSFDLNGFSPSAPVTLSINGNVVAQVTPESNGYAGGVVTADLAPGTYTLTASSAIGDASYDFIVFDDADHWEDYDETPTAKPSRRYVTESWLEDNQIIFSLEGFPDYSSIEIYLNGEFLERIPYQWREEYALTQDLAVGQYTVEFRHPAGNVSVDIDIQPDAQGNPVFSGDWTGNAVQTGAASYDWSELDQDEVPENHTYPLTLHIDDSGNLTSLSGEFWWVCIGVQTGYIDSGYSDLAASQVPTTPLTIDRPFELEWTANAFDYLLVGVLNADGTSSGTLTASLGACGRSTLEWGTEYDGEIPTPSPTPEPSEEPTEDPIPEPTEQPTEEPTSSPTEEPTSSPTQEPTPEPTDTTKPTDEPSPEPTDSPAPSESSQPDPSDSASPEPSTSEPSDESPSSEPTIPDQTPSEDDLDDDNARGVTAPQMARAGEAITVHLGGVADGSQVGVWLFSDPVYLGSPAVQNSAVQVTVPAATTAGDHRIAVYTAEGELIGWDTIRVLTAEQGGSDDDSTDEATHTDDSDPSTGGAADDTATGAAQGAGKSSSDASSTTSADGGTGLARTGASIAFVSLAGIALLTAGAVLLLRRRQQQS